MRRTFLIGLLLSLTLTTLGCGGARERGKNSDFDRPTTQKK